MDEFGAVNRRFQVKRMVVQLRSCDNLNVFSMFYVSVGKASVLQRAVAVDVCLSSYCAKVVDETSSEGFLLNAMQLIMSVVRTVMLGLHYLGYHQHKDLLTAGVGSCEISKRKSRTKAN